MARIDKLLLVITTFGFLAIIAGVAAYLGLIPGVGVKKIPSGEDCYTVWQNMGKEIYETEYNVSLVFKDKIEDQPVSGVNIYSFEEKPYYWGEYAKIGSIITGKTPVATSGDDGKAIVTVLTPEAKGKTKTYYLVATATGYWSDLYTLDIGLKASVVYPYDVCKDLSLQAFVDQKLRDVLSGHELGKRIYLHKIGTLDAPTSKAFGVPADAAQTAWKKTISLSYTVSDGYYRITGIKITPGAEFLETPTDFEGVHRITVTITRGQETIVKDAVIFDELDEESPLRKDGYFKVDNFNGKKVLELGPDEGITIKVTIVADTETTATGDNAALGPGEEVLSVKLNFAHPQDASPVTTSVTG